MQALYAAKACRGTEEEQAHADAVAMVTGAQPEGLATHGHEVQGTRLSQSFRRGALCIHTVLLFLFLTWKTVCLFKDEFHSYQISSFTRSLY